MNDIEYSGPHGTLTMGKLIAWCAVGAIMWAVILLTAIKLYGVL